MPDQSASLTALITGASTGIGRACALRLDARGWRVFAGVRRPEDGEALTRDASERLTWLYLDVTDGEQIRAAADTIRAAVATRGLDALINNAGIVVAAPVEIVPVDQLRHQLEVNTIGVVAVTQAMLPMLRAARGRIVNVSSISGRLAFPLLGPYAASKFALGALSDALRVELHGSGVHVICIEPGSVKTPIWDKSVNAMERVVNDLPEDVVEPYKPMLLAAAANAQQKNDTGMPVEVVVDRIERALLDPKPRAHDVIGRGTRRTFRIVRLLPWSWRDRLFAKGMEKLVQKHAASA
jgi:NAD(P)-dependent dehydrogenase (short-subunit alcohol dehydrogenase family)